MRLLFVKESLAWPRSSGHDVHCYQMMRALAAQGHSISLAAVHPPLPKALEGLAFQNLDCLNGTLLPRTPFLCV